MTKKLTHVIFAFQVTRKLAGNRAVGEIITILRSSLTRRLTLGVPLSFHAILFHVCTYFNLFTHLHDYLQDYLHDYLGTRGHISPNAYLFVSPYVVLLEISPPSISPPQKSSFSHSLVCLSVFTAHVFICNPLH